jgi:hypothetical protein
LAAKWFGSIASTRWAALVLFLIASLGVATSGLDLRAIPALLLAWLVFAAFQAGLGLWFSVRSRTTQRALLGTLLATAAFGAGHWLAWVLVLPVISWLKGPHALSTGWLDLQALGLTPPLTLAFLAFPPPDHGGWRNADWQWALDPLLRGLVFWAVGAVVFWFLALARFRQTLVSADGASPEVMAPRWLPRAPRFRRALLLMVTALVLGWLLIDGDVASRRFDEAVADTERIDPRWRTDELEEDRRVVPDEENGALQVPIVPDERRAFGRRRWCPDTGFPTQEAFDALDHLSPQIQLTPQQLQILTDQLEGVEEALLQSRCLVNFSTGRYPITYAKDGISTLLPHVQRARHLANLQAFDALMRTHEGDLDGALQSCRAIVNAGRINGDEPIMVTMLTRCACINVAFPKIERVLAQGEASEDALRALQRVLEKETRERPFLLATRGERAMFDRLLESLEDGTITQLGLMESFYGLKNSWFERGLLRTGISLHSQRAALLQFSSQMVEAAKLPAHEVIDRFEGLNQEAKELPIFARALLINDSQAIHFLKVANAFHRHQAVLRSAVVLVAVERYRRAHRVWPESLAPLVPKYLEAVPLDPFDGQPLRYRKLADGVIVYSIGPDRQDDGGLLTNYSLRSLQDAGGAKGDIGLRLWDVNSRRQAAPSSENAPQPSVR